MGRSRARHCSFNVMSLVCARLLSMARDLQCSSNEKIPHEFMGEGGVVFLVLTLISRTKVAK